MFKLGIKLGLCVGIVAAAVELGVRHAREIEWIKERLIVNLDQHSSLSEVDSALIQLCDAINKRVTNQLENQTEINKQVGDIGRRVEELEREVQVLNLYVENLRRKG